MPDNAIAPINIAGPEDDRLAALLEKSRIAGNDRLKTLEDDPGLILAAALAADRAVPNIAASPGALIELHDLGDSVTAATWRAVSAALEAEIGAQPLEHDDAVSQIWDTWRRGGFVRALVENDDLRRYQPGARDRAWAAHAEATRIINDEIRKAGT